MITSTSLLNAIRTPSSPFPGLRPFEFDESHLFFGRDEQIEKMMVKLFATRFLAVVGTSGSGKSSLVRAGLIPALHSGMMTEAAGKWRVALLRPGSDPIGNLSRALNEPDVFGSAETENVVIQNAVTEATLRLGSRGLVEAVRQNLMPEGENLLVLVDQFEELFRFAKRAHETKDDHFDNESAAFVKLLLEAVKQDNPDGDCGKIYVVLTMRSDYLGDCAQFWDLPEAINESEYLTPRLTRDQLHEAIEGPVAIGGGQIATRLVNQLINDITDYQDQLPVLQHALMRTWDEWKHPQHSHQTSPGVIDLCCSEAIGGMAKALSIHADEAYKDDLPDDRHREITEKMFKALTEKGEDNREIRRQVTLGELCEVANADESEVKTVIEAFRRPGRSFLMPPAGSQLNKSRLIDISHESLIRVWQRLQQWVEEESESAAVYHRLGETAELHEADEAELWHGADLESALEWEKKNRPTPAWAQRYHSNFDGAMAFLRASERKRDEDRGEAERQQREEVERTKRELAQAQALAKAQQEQAEAELQKLEEQRLRLEEQAKYSSRLHGIIAGLIVLALLAFGVAFYASKQKEKAEAATVEAKKQTEKAEAATVEAKKQTEKAEAATVEAKKQTEKAKEAEGKAQEAARQALEKGKIAKEQELHALRLSYFGKAQSATRAFGVGNFAIANAMFDEIAANNKISAMRGFEWYLTWGQYHNERQTIPAHNDPIWSVAYSPDGRLLATGSADNTVKLWDTSRLSDNSKWKKELAQLKHDGLVRCLAFSPDGKTLATGSWDKTVRLWDVSTMDFSKPIDTRKPNNILQHNSAVYSISFYGNKLLAVGLEEGKVSVWNLIRPEKPVREKELPVHENTPVNAVAFSPDGKWLAVGSEWAYYSWEREKHKTLKVWNAKTWLEKDAMEGNTSSRILTLAYDGEELWTGGGDKRLKIWDRQLKLKAEYPASSDDIVSLAFSTSGILAWAGDDGAVNVILDGKLVQLGGHLDFVTSVAFDPLSETLASVGWDGTIKLWETDVRSRQKEIPGSSHITSLAFSRDGKRLITGSKDTTMKLLSPDSLKGFVVNSSLPRDKAWEKNYAVNCVAISPDGKVAASCGSRMRFWDLNQNKYFFLDDHTKDNTSTIISLAFSPDNRTLVSVERDMNNNSMVWLWDLKTGKEKRLPIVQDNINLVVFSPNGNVLATAGGIVNGTVRFWSTKDWREVTRFECKHFYSIVTMAFSPDGTMLATGAQDERIKLWDLKSRKQLATLRGHTQPVSSIAFSPDGKLLASGSDDATIKLWDVKERQEVVTLKNLDENAPVYAVAFSTDGKMLVSGDEKRLKLWIAATKEEVAAHKLK